ncbi:MAG TPA: hypothetical protein VKV24_05370 [Casimicrobiaceae bacterium]|nr:hypothetical protein [Casimicrobiaceae bacterium]
MANAPGKCAHAACRCDVQPGQRYCSTSCAQQAQQQGGSSRQQGQQQSASGASHCNCDHPSCQHG